MKSVKFHQHCFYNIEFLEGFHLDWWELALIQATVYHVYSNRMQAKKF